MAPAGGPPAECYFRAETPPRWQLSGGAGFMDSTLKFDSARRADVQMSSLSLSAARIATDGWTPRLTLGVVLDGELSEHDGPRHDIRPGGFVSAGLERRIHQGAGRRPSLDVAVTASATWAHTELPGSAASTPYFATDLRLGARAGWRLGSRVFPFVAARIFGGPVAWEWDGEDVQGSDVHHYQVGAGLALQLGRMAAYAEWAPLGEYGLGLGLSTVW